MKRKAVTIPLILIISLFLFAVPAFGQGAAPITATVDRTSLSTDDTLTLTVNVNTSVMNAPQPVLPPMDGFNIVGSSTSSQISIINGAVTSRLSHIYRLQPYQSGDLTIDSISLTVNGQTFNTDPITVQVTQGTGTSTQQPTRTLPDQVAPTELAGQDFFVEAEVSNSTPYVGEQVIYTFRFYQAVNLFDRPTYQAPGFTGFWSEGEMDRAEYRTQAAGRVYQVTELNSPIFPTQAGEVTIDPAMLNIPGSLLRSGATFQTRPVSVEVQPLPAGAPDGFNGAVGQFSLSAEVDSTQSVVNEPLTLRTVLSGQGNLKAAPDPIWPEVDGWRSFESQATINTDMRQAQVSGSKVYERLMVPQRDGNFTLPPITYVYFDPVLAQYQTVATEPIQVAIAPGQSGANPPVTSVDTPVEEAGPTLHEVRLLSAESDLGSGNIMAEPIYWLAWGIPLVGLIGFIVWRRRQQYRANNSDRIRASQAGKKAHKALSQAQKDGLNAYGTAGDILNSYISDKLNQPVSGLTHQTLVQTLNQHGIKPDLVSRVDTALAVSEWKAFSPGGQNDGGGPEHLKEVDNLIEDLEKAF